MIENARSRHDGRALIRKDLDRIGVRFGLDRGTILEMKAIAAVLPFRTNAYVLEDLIRWHEVPDDPVYQNTFPQPGMLRPADLDRMTRLVRSGASSRQIRTAAREIQSRLRLHAQDRPDVARPACEARKMPEIQHTYRESVCCFVNQAHSGPVCCAYCFCWPRFAGIRERGTAGDERHLGHYVSAHRELKAVVFTGAEPLALSTAELRCRMEPLLAPEYEHLLRIEIETQAPACWPQRFLADLDADDLLRLFEDIHAAGKELSLRVPYVHPRELETKAAQDALRRILATGAFVRGLSPIVRGVNDDVATWAELWTRQVKLGALPDAMQVRRDTGPGEYFRVSLARASQIHRDAYAEVCARVGSLGGPAMRADPGTVGLVGETRIHGERLFVLELVQARDPKWIGRPFFARWDAKAGWLDELRPAFGDNSFFYEEGLRRMQDGAVSRASIW